ncbi:hypothetical protein AFLA_013049 [Aspergillus flavus NRRL3357]|nr:hypothetical protein AFLA_013049 [Aspergillus flavus NRRL3357]
MVIRDTYRSTEELLHIANILLKVRRDFAWFSPRIESGWVSHNCLVHERDRLRRLTAVGPMAFSAVWPPSEFCEDAVAVALRATFSRLVATTVTFAGVLLDW